MNKLENENQVKRIIYKSEGSKFGNELNIYDLIDQIERQYASATTMTDDGLYKPMFIKSLLKVESPYQHLRIEVAAEYKIITEEQKNDFYLKGLKEREAFIDTIRRRIISFESGLSARLRTISNLPGTFHLSVKKDANNPEIEEYGIFYKGEPFNLKCLKCNESFYKELNDSGVNSIFCHNKREKCSNKEEAVNGNFRYFKRINEKISQLV
ncbi:hypothetical protein P4679_24440 [Priestia megaterium]|uniref:hypothetical protein n=1 Tax=Priestia megaterium TaxID=1404 RepID=UPI002E1B1B08|nr:hypothetical protein [Priestia megaterium]